MLSGLEQSAYDPDADGVVTPKSRLVKVGAKLSDSTRAAPALLRGGNTRELCESQIMMYATDYRSNLSGRDTRGRSRKERLLFFVQCVSNTKTGDGEFKAASLPMYDIVDDGLFHHGLQLLIKRVLLNLGPLMSKDEANGARPDGTDEPLWWSTRINVMSDSAARTAWAELITAAKNAHPDELSHIRFDAKELSEFASHLLRRRGCQLGFAGGMNEAQVREARCAANKEKDPLVA